MIFHIITIFPVMFEDILDNSILKRAQLKGRIKFKIYDLRDFAKDRHRVVDDYSYGGGSGMILKIGPIYDALESILGKGIANRKRKASIKRDYRVVLTSPQGKRFDEEKAKELARVKNIVLICGHYEGVDERVREYLVDEDISIGDYVLTGGELPAMVIIDAVSRLIRGVLPEEEVYKRDSFYEGILDYPHYTRPERFMDMNVPSVLLSGNHAQIEEWRRKKALEITRRKRPDLMDKCALSDREPKVSKSLIRQRY